MAITPENLPRWADTSSSYYVEPSSSKKDVGWQSEEKPPYQYMNWIHYSTYTWLSYLNSIATEQSSSFFVRSNDPLLYSSGTITFTSNIEIIFREGTTTYLNYLSTSDSPLSVADGEVLVFKKSTASSSVSLIRGTYGSLAEGEYDIVSESSLTEDEAHLEVILFRRRDISAGNDIYSVGYSTLEIPTLGREIRENSYFYLGGENFSSPLHVPVGSIIPHYDFNGAYTIDTNYWAYCDGSNVNIWLNGVAINQTLPDLSNRYLVGFGTDGGGDIDSASWATASVGNASHQVNLQHSHTVDAHNHSNPAHNHTLSAHTHTGPSHSHDMGNHTHDLGNHTHTGPSHTHSGGTLQFQVATWNGTDTLTFYKSDGVSIVVRMRGDRAATGGGGVDMRYTVTDGLTDPPYTLPSTASGATASDGTGATGTPSTNTSSTPSTNTTSASGTGSTGTPSTDSTDTSGSTTSGNTAPSTDNQLSTTQSIQPSSIRVRFIMRIK